VASSTAHFIVGAALALPAVRRFRSWTVPVSAGILAAIPDLDLAGRRLLGIRPGTVFAHRGFFHSPFFLILLAAALAGIVARLQARKVFVALWLVWAGCMVTHPLMDAMTDGGRGVMLEIPFSRARMYLPWRPIHTPPGSESLLSRALVLRPTEIPFCTAALIVGVFGWWRRKPK
jgi:inner membrane protein